MIDPIPSANPSTYMTPVRESAQAIPHPWFAIIHLSISPFYTVQKNDETSPWADLFRWRIVLRKSLRKATTHPLCSPSKWCPVESHTSKTIAQPKPIVRPRSQRSIHIATLTGTKIIFCHYAKTFWDACSASSFSGLFYRRIWVCAIPQEKSRRYSNHKSQYIC